MPIRKSPLAKRKKPIMGDIFARRWVITVPRSGVITIAATILLSTTLSVVVTRFVTVTNLCITVAALLCVIQSRRIVRNLRYEINMTLHGMDENDDTPVTDNIPLHPIKVVNGTDITRISR